MTCYYLDASGLVKRYVDEPGSQWLRRLVASEPPQLLFTSRLTIVEVTSAFARRVRDGTVSAADFTLVRDAFRADCLKDYQIIPPDLAVIDRACQLLEQYPLRAYDSIHLATALNAQAFLARKGYPSLMFISSDQRLNGVAEMEGIQVADPNQHS